MDDEPFRGSELGGGELEAPGREPGGISWILEVEVEAVPGLRRDVVGEGSLADLPRPEDRDGRCLLEALQNAVFVSSLNHLSSLLI